MMDIAIVGPGEVVIRFIDKKGQTLIQERLIVSGSPTVEGRRTIALSVKTTSGSVGLAPVLIQQSNPKQRVTFDSETPSRFTWKRCKEIGCATDIMAKARHGRAAPLAQGDGSVVLTDDQRLAKMIRTKVRSNSDRKT
jgi:hypothetical protein